MNLSERAAVEAMAGYLQANISELFGRLRKPCVRRLAVRLVQEVGLNRPDSKAVIPALVRSVEASAIELSKHHEDLLRAISAIEASVTPEAKQKALIEHLTAFSGGALSPMDRAATSRFLDVSALRERMAARMADRLDEIEVACAAIGQLSGHTAPLELPALAKSSRLFEVLFELVKDTRFVPARMAAIQCFIKVVSAVPADRRLAFTQGANTRILLSLVEDAESPRWVRALALTAFARVFNEECLAVIERLLRERAHADSALIRFRALRELPGLKATDSRLRIALEARTDPSEHVRLGLCSCLGKLSEAGASEFLFGISLEDSSPRVRAFALRELVRRALEHAEDLELAERAIVETLDRLGAPRFESGGNAPLQESLPVRMALKLIPELFEEVRVRGSGRTVAIALARLANREDASAEIVELSAATLRKLESESDEALSHLVRVFESALSRIDEGKRRTVALPVDATPSAIERALATAARGDMTVSLRHIARGKVELVRGERRRFSLWRALYELRTPMPDKRKGFVHTHGRRRDGDVIVPTSCMAEVTKTRVPGERQLLPNVGGSGPYLPRVDDLLFAAESSRPLKLVTSMGSVTLEGPRSFFRRMRVRFVLSTRYQAYTELRTRSLEATEASEGRAYRNAIESLGFSVQLEGAKGEIKGEPFLLSCWPVGRVLSAIPALTGPLLPFQDFMAYLLSPTGNRPRDLAIFAWILFMFVVLRAAWLMRKIERAKEAIPLSIGGWGTRGKSGTERLKAALFHALRFDVVVKTTGCEAMFIHAMRDLPAHELFIHRPYDKATIWEQTEVLHTAERLSTQVFLWECMALQPRLVDTLIEEWMKDEITTLTNAYPDHEDIQGPTGEDVARVIARFMPKEGLTFTSEDQMLPILRDAAKKRSTRLIEVSPLEAELLPADLLARLPYEEHPRNVALVLALAEHFGVERDFALAEMADRVVPDLGVLKTYPAVEHGGRKLSFTNGMSANERAGFLSNWTRTGFDQHDCEKTPESTTVVLINNRGDRVARSRVFARILAEDVAVDTVVLIGTNLGGMLTFITEAITDTLKRTSLESDAGVEGSLSKFDSWLRRVGVSLTAEFFCARLEQMLTTLAIDQGHRKGIVEASLALLQSSGSFGDQFPLLLSGCEVDSREVTSHAILLASRIQMARSARATIEAHLRAGNAGEANRIFRKVIRDLFMGRVHTLNNSDATGDQVIDFVARSVAPGLEARIMGSQNIKGTGLDFAYRWVSIQRVRDALAELRKNGSKRAHLLTWLHDYDDFGVIDAREALTALREIQSNEDPAWEPHRILLRNAIERVARKEASKVQGLTAGARFNLVAQVLRKLEEVLDHLDSIRRTRKARAVLSDLYAQRIGHERAAQVLREITDRQKGGWLSKLILG